jgi:hypothetical protein
MHYVTHRSHWMQKHNFSVMCPGVLIMETASDPTEHEKECIDVSQRGFTEMHYVTHRSHWIENYKFGITCPAVIFMETASGPPNNEK